MSGIFSRGARSPTNVTADNKSNIAPSQTGQTEDNQNVPQTPQNRTQSAPRTMPDIPDSPLGSSNGENEGEMVPAAGRVNESGEVIDDEGNAIGRVTTEGEASRFAGYIVTQEGDILDHDGGVVGRAEPLDDVASNLNYTTKSAREGATTEGGEEDYDGDEQQRGQPEKKQGGGLGGVLGGVTNTAGSAVSGVTGGLGKATKGVTGTVGDTAKGATDTVGEATGTEDATGAVGDTVKGATDTTGDAAEGVTNAAGDAAEGVTGAAEDTAEGVADAAENATQDAPGIVDDATEQVPKDLTDTTDAAERPEGVADDVGDAVDDATQGLEAPDTAIEGAAGSAGKAAEDIPKDVQKEAEDVAEAAPSGAGSGDKGSQAQGLAEQVPEPMAEVPSLSPSINQKVAALFDGPFTIADGGKVTDQSGKVLGKLASGSDIQDLIGKQVKGIDEQGNLLGEDDTVIGKVDIAPEGSMIERVKEEVPEAADRLNALEQQKAPEQLQEEVGDASPVKIPSFTSSVAGKVIDMFEKPFNIAENGQVTDQNGKVLGNLAKTSDIQDLVGKEVTGIDGKGNLLGDNGSIIGKVDIAPEGSMAERVKEQVPEAAERLDALEEQKAQVPIKIPSFTSSVAGKVINMFEGPFKIAEDGQVTDQNGKILGKLAKGQDFQSLIGKDIKGIDQHGNLLGDNDTELGKIDLVPEGSIVERIKEEVPEAAERLDAIEAAKKQAEEAAGPDLSILEGLKINKMGNVVDSNGNPIGRVKSGDLKRLIGKSADKNGKIWDDRGNIIGEVETFPEAVKNESSPFEDFPDATVDKFGKVIYDGRQVGVVVGDDWQKLIGKKVDADGDILDKNGNVIGHAERREEEEPQEPEEEQIDYSMLKGKKVNKLGNVVDDKGQVWGHVVQGVVKLLNGKSVGDNGQIFNDAGQVMGKAEPIPDSEREEAKEPAPFEDFPDAIVGDNGDVIAGGEKIGIVVEGDAKKLKGKSVDADGDILDRAGNKLGHAERWEAEPEPEPEAIDMSSLAGKRINKAGNAVDSRGDIYGRVIEGSLSRLIGKMCDKNGFIRNEGGDVIGKCELIPEAEREGMKEGPFTELSGCTVTKEGKVVTPGGDVVGRLVSGDAKVLAGRPVDDDGDVCDKNGNVLGHAERWEEPEVPKEVNPMSGRKVNREGNVMDENGDIMGKLTSGELSQCAGKKIDDDGDVVDQKGNAIGHCSLLEEIPAETKEINPMSGRRVNREGNVVDENGDLMGKLTSGELSQCAGKKIDDDGDVVDQKGAVLGHCSLLEEIPREKTPEPTETDEEREARLRKEQDAKIAKQIGYCLTQSLDKIKPICRMIVERINQEEAKSEEDRDEEELVKQVRPLIEEGGKILTEANGVIRGLDPDGRISAQAQHHSAGNEATPEEYHLAELLKELTGTVTETIENAKRKLENLPKAKKGINPLWGLLSEPLFQIIAAVGLLLSGVLGLVGKLLNGLGLGGLVNNLLGGLGLTKVLDGLGLGSVLAPITGKKK